MNEKYIEKHHLIFYIATIVVIFFIESITRDFSELKSTFVGFMVYVFILILMTNCLLFIIYVSSARKLLGDNYKTENPLSHMDILLTPPAIITAFIIDDLYSILDSITGYSFLLTIVLIPIIYLIIWKLNGYFLISLSS